MLADENVIEVAACPPNQEDCFVSFEPPSDDQIIFNEKYQPLLQELGFPGPVFFTKSKTGFFDFPNMGHAYASGYSVSASLRLHPTQERKLPKCDGYMPVGYLYDCYIALDENWAIHWLGFNDEMTNACSGQSAYDACDPETRANDDWSCFKECTDKLNAEALAKQSLSQLDQ